MKHGHAGLNSHQSMIEMVHDEVVRQLKNIRKYMIKNEGYIFRILDLGCGDGGLTNRIAMTLEESDDLIGYCSSVEVVGVDFNEELISRANDNFCSIGSNRDTTGAATRKNKITLRFLQGDATTLGLSDKFDCIVSNAVLHHIPSDKIAQTIQRMSNALSDNGGILVMELGGKGNLDPIFDIYKSVVREQYGELYYGSALCPEFYYPSLSQMTTLLEKECIEVTYANLYYCNRYMPFTSDDNDEAVKQWLYMFGKATNLLPPSLFLKPDHEAIVDSILKIIQTQLKQTNIYDEENQQLTIPHRRLRIVAQKITEAERIQP
jgi:SAM-dependent methyltransferase